MSERISLLQHLTLAARAGHLDPALVTVVQQIGAASRQISAALTRAALAGVLGAVETSNASGETQKKLDVLANDAFLQALSWTGAVAGIASEELDGPYRVPGATGDYLVLLDPLDGSSNIDVNISVGSIFSILRARSGAAGLTDADFLQPGTAQVCAGFTVYGPATVMVLCFGHGVQGFTLDPVSGEFLLTQPTSASRSAPPSTPSTRPTSAGGSRRCSATSPSAWPARTARAGGTSTCAGWARWWATCTAC